MEEYEELKYNLSQKFLLAKKRGFTDEQVEIAKQCTLIGQALSVSQRYKMIPFLSLIQQNKELTKLNNALGLVLQYITDLLSPELPPNWFSIATKNRTYAFRMKNVIGVEEIFSIAGYTKKTRDFLSFPEGDRVKPDREKLANLATEVLLAREECVAAVDGKITLNLEEQQPSPFLGAQNFTNYSDIQSGERCESVGFTPQLQTERISNPLHHQTAPQQYQGPSNPPVPKPRVRTKLIRKQSSDECVSPSQSHKFSDQLSESSSIGETPVDDGNRSDSSGSKNNSGIQDILVSSIDTSVSTSSKSELELKKEALKKRRQEMKEREKERKRTGPLTGIISPSYSNPDISGPSKNSEEITTPPRSKQLSTEVIIEEDVPDTPNKCPHCHSHIGESGVCTYCSPSSSLSGQNPKQFTFSTSKPAEPLARPVPKPRPRKPKESQASNQQPQPTHLPSNNPGPVPSVPEVRNIPRPLSNEQLPHQPLDTTDNEHSRDEMTTLKDNQDGLIDTTSYASHQSTLTNTPSITQVEQSPTPPGATGPSALECKVLDDQFMKYQREAEHFATLTLREQDDWLDKKIQHGESVNHLKTYYAGPDWAGRKERREIEEFEKMLPHQQKIYLKDKNARKEKTSHLAKFYNAPNANQRAFDDAQHTRKKQKAREDGKKLCEWIKICAKDGYTPKEVEIAYSCYTSTRSSNPLEYLKTTWQGKMRRIETSLNHHKDHPGVPSREEVRRHLIEAKGSVQKASLQCSKERLTKIKELEEKFVGRIKVDRQVLIECLTQCDLDVQEAFYAVQRKTLTELYKYLLSSKEASDVGSGEGTEEKGKTDMEAMKEKVLEKTKDKEDKKAYSSCVRMLMAENKFKNSKKAEMLIQILSEKSDYPMKYYIDAVKNYDTVEEAKKFLNQPCPICMDEFLMDDIIALPFCGCTVCKECFTEHFKLVIKEQSVKHFNCPLCGQPDLANEVEDIIMGILVAMVKELCDKETYDLCQQKLTDFNLSKQPNFVWCINEECRSGFLTDRVDRLRVECPNCHKDMCFLCKKKWEHHHEGLTCDQFTQWKIDNDPEAQKQGLAAHLAEHGIQCPACKIRYDLARGGCMHFRCTQCPNEFCSGCGGTIKQGDACGKFEWCKKFGLHAHHPRDCLFYLRDFQVAELQDLLMNNNVKFDIDPPKAQLDAARKGQQDQDIVVEDVEGEDKDAVLGEPIAQEDDQKPVEFKCCVMLQKEGPDGLYDEKCGQPTPEKMAGLCETHYKEYLVGKINKEKVDPIDLYPLNQLVRILEREEKEVPDQEDDDNEDEYREKLIEHIKQELPLQRTESLNFVSTK